MGDLDLLRTGGDGRLELSDVVVVRLSFVFVKDVHDEFSIGWDVLDAP